MAIKKRTRVVDPEALEAFAAAADSSPAKVPASAQSTRPEVEESSRAIGAPAMVRNASSADAKGWPAGLAKTLLIRWPNPTLPAELNELATTVDRSQHKTALIALELGLQVLKEQVRNSN